MKTLTLIRITTGILVLIVSIIPRSTLAQEAAGKGLVTQWDKDVSQTNPLPEYPRPTMQRAKWQSLNGQWDYSIGDEKVSETPAAFDGKILVPYPLESTLSGVRKVMAEHKKLWYHRTFSIPADWAGSQVLLHFGAVNWQSTVVLNGKSVAEHKGGFDAFAVDITAELKPGDNDLVVAVTDPLTVNSPDAQVVGKQRRHPGGIFYTASTGIWQTVWLEPVPEIHIDSLKIVPDFDRQQVTINVIGKIPATKGPVMFPVVIFDNGREVARGHTFEPISIPNPKSWTPTEPNLYTFHIGMAEGVEKINDPIDGYFAMRKISLGKDEKGQTRIFLNNRFTFQVGVLDQGYWPDGIYTAPTDEALKSDIVAAKGFGFNLLRKHAKVEPERWYYWTDKLGMLVWQDMPQCFGEGKKNTLSDECKSQWTTEWKTIIAQRFNHPSIVVWTTFNEGWGQHDTENIVAMTKELDPSRLVNNASGWTDKGVGDIHDTHAYPGPWCEKPEENRAVVNGEFGGVTMRVKGHMWSAATFGYGATLSQGWAVTETYQKLLKKAYQFSDDRFMSAIVYTQLTDVEGESNGLLTYDRAVVKPLADIITAANKGQFLPMPAKPETLPSNDILPTSEETAQTWLYTTEKPADDWFMPEFDAKSWKSGPAPFGRGYPSNTPWTDTPGDIYIRRPFNIINSIPDKLAIHVIHDEDVEIYINGVLAGSAKGYVGEYVDLPLSEPARAALKTGANVICAHCHQTIGGQVIDVGLAVPQE